MSGRRPGRDLVGRAAVVVGVTATLLLALPAMSVEAAVGAPVQEEDDLPAPVLTYQTATVGTGADFELRLDPASLPADGSVELVLHGRIRSRSELDVSMAGDALRTTVYRVVTPVSDLPAAPDGSLRVVLSLDPTQPGGLNLGASGVYPLEVRARDATDAPLGRLITHLVREPSADDESPPLAVAVVARALQEPVLQPDGTRPLEPEGLAATTAWLTAVAGGGAPVNLAVSPEAVAAVIGAADEGDGPAAALAAQLRGIADNGSVVPSSYAPTTPDALLAADLPKELTTHLDAAAATVGELLDASPGSTWLATDDLGAAGARTLARHGVRRFVVEPDQVEPLRSGLLSLSLAQPFLLRLDDSSVEVEALALDPDVVGRLDTDVEPALEASHLVAELAMLWFEQPGIARAAVVPLDETIRSEVVTAVLGGLRGGRILEAVTLDEAFERSRPLVQPGGGRVDRELAPEDPPGVAGAVRAGLPAARELLGGLTSLLDVDGGGDASTGLGTAADHLLLATSTALDAEAQTAHLDAVGTDAAALTSAIETPAQETITLTAREGTVPLVLRNTSEVPLHVTVRLTSAKLEFPDGDVIPLVLEAGSTRIDIAVRALASGSFPLDITITSPDESLVLAEVEYSIRSTAVAGAGVVLSAGAALFLLVWWARHWHRTRRSAKLIEAKHLSHPSGAKRTEGAAADH